MNIIDAFVETARLRPDHPAVEDGDRIVTYAELEALADGASANLLSAGVNPRDIVAIILADSVEQVALFWALARIGAVAFPINVRTLRDEHVAGLGGHPLKFAIVEDVSVSLPSGVKALSPQMIFAIQPGAAKAGAPPTVGDDMPLVCAQSSGTTGTPKTFQRSHNQIFVSIRSKHPLVQPTSEDRYIAMIRLGFYSGWRNCFAMLASGGTIIINRAQSVEELVRYIIDKRVTLTVMTPVHVRTLLKYAVGRPPIFPLVRALRVGTGAITKGERALSRKHITPNIVLDYGLNELNWISFATPEDQDARPDAVGRPDEGIEAQIVDDDHRPLPPGEVGLIRFRAAHAANSYLNNPEATARTFRDGWVYPMDLAAMDEDGYIFLKGRADDRISVDGIKFYPIEVENVLRDHPMVTEAVVFAWPHPHHGEVPVAAVTTRETVSRKSLGAFCKEHLATYKLPRDIVVVPEMPRNPMGKIRKAKVKEDLHEELTKKFAGSSPGRLG